jgi:hypothetical protein
MKLQQPNGKEIASWEQWTQPKQAIHWKAGRSAMELAKAWFRDGKLSVPVEIADLLASHSRMQGLKIEKGVPELVTPLPERGEGRNHDLALIGHTGNEQVTICIEAKADEPYGNDTVGEYFRTALEKKAGKKRTRASDRIAQLLTMVGLDIGELFACPWSAVRYQLLTAICGTAIQAKLDGSVCAAFVVHEFHTASTQPNRIEKNEQAYNGFLKAMLGKENPCTEAGQLQGPCKVNGMDCYIGKAVAVNGGGV